MPKSQPTEPQKKSKAPLSIVKLDSTAPNPSPRTKRFDPLTAVRARDLVD
jgi:cell cycle checkpoint protein